MSRNEDWYVPLWKRVRLAWAVLRGRQWWGNGYPTPWAYERVCEVLTKTRKRRSPLHFDGERVLIVDCLGCVDPTLADTPGRQCDGVREWTAKFLEAPDPEHSGHKMLVPENEDALRCPECGRPGRVYVY